MKLTNDQIDNVTRVVSDLVEEIVREQQLHRQRLVPLAEAQEIANTFNEIKLIVEELREEISKPGFPVGSARSRLDSIESRCNHAILAMHDHFHRGRKRPR